MALPSPSPISASPSPNADFSRHLTAPTGGPGGPVGRGNKPPARRERREGEEAVKLNPSPVAMQWQVQQMFSLLEDLHDLQVLVPDLSTGGVVALGCHQLILFASSPFLRELRAQIKPTS